MGLYNAVFGVNQNFREILEVLAMSVHEFGRFRDAFVTQGEIAVYTRLGGGNRPDYAETINRLQGHPLYLRDRDDSFDSTYATFYFSIPEESKARLAAFDVGSLDTDARWKEAIENLKNPAEAERIAKKYVVFKTIKPGDEV